MSVDEKVLLCDILPFNIQTFEFSAQKFNIHIKWIELYYIMSDFSLLT